MADNQKPYVIFPMCINITEDMMAFARFQAGRLSYADAEDYLGALVSGALLSDWDSFEQWLREENPNLLVEDELIRLGYLVVTKFSSH